MIKDDMIEFQMTFGSCRWLKEPRQAQSSSLSSSLLPSLSLSSTFQTNTTLTIPITSWSIQSQAILHILLTMLRWADCWKNTQNKSQTISNWKMVFYNLQIIKKINIQFSSIIELPMNEISNNHEGLGWFCTKVAVKCMRHQRCNS